MATSSQIIALWTAPRSISSAFERCMAQRTDTDSFFEPFFNIYHFSQWRQESRFGEYEKAWDYSPAKAVAKLRGGAQPFAFFKEMGSIYLPYQDPAFLQSITNTFLIRRPEFSLKGWLKMGDVPNEQMLGFVRLGELWKLVTKELGLEPVVVEASTFQDEPEATLRKYCTRVGLEFDPRMLSWERQEHTTWDKELMTDENWAKWQRVLNNSTGILSAPTHLPYIPNKYQHLLEPALEVYEMISRHAL